MLRQLQTTLEFLHSWRRELLWQRPLRFIHCCLWLRPL
jgi:hypothetical protein